MKSGACMRFTVHSLYICVKNMARAVAFYEKLFEQPAISESPVFSIFDVDGFRYCLFDHEKAGEKVLWGDNCLPSLEVPDIDEALKTVTDLGCAIVFPLTPIGNNMVFEFKDSEGNDIEVYMCRTSARFDPAR